jgi:TRAP-type C4-dicarboxylate transport system permease small subunit
MNGKAWKMFEKTVERVNGFAGGIAALCLVAAALVVTEGIVVRKLFGMSAIWQIEASVFLLIFATFVGAPLVQRNEKHLNVDLVLIHLSPRTREIVLILVSVLSCLICALLAWYAWPMWWEALTRNDHSESLWGPPLWIPYLFLPLGMTLFFLQYIVHIKKKIDHLKNLSDEENVSANKQ